MKKRKMERKAVITFYHLTTTTQRTFISSVIARFQNCSFHITSEFTKDGSIKYPFPVCFLLRSSQSLIQV